jgi:NAD(P)-dependent dehydrogenase (short-subunit alcohol dehydrogenase family)
MPRGSGGPDLARGNTKGVAVSGELEGKVAIVTGAGASGPGWGTGKATAVTFARAGARLVLVDLDPAASAVTEALIAEEGGQALSVACDVSSEADVQQAINAATTHFGGLDILVNNVGILLAQGLLNESAEQWERTMAVNAKGVFLMCKYAMPHLLQSGGGRIINIASVAGLRVTTLPPSYGYAASKAAILHMTRAIALEFAGQGLRCNSIVPGMLDTTNVRTALAGLGLSKDEIEARMQRRDTQTPPGKQGDAFDVAEAALFLASRRAKFINGAEILVDGGQIQGTAR